MMTVSPRSQKTVLGRGEELERRREERREERRGEEEEEEESRPV
jgi:hypothetical protein